MSPMSSISYSASRLSLSSLTSCSEFSLGFSAIIFLFLIFLSSKSWGKNKSTIAENLIKLIFSGISINVVIFSEECSLQVKNFKLS